MEVKKKIIVNINDTFYSNSKEYKFNVLDLIVSLKKVKISQKSY